MFNAFGLCGLGSLGASNAPTGGVAQGYYVAGTRFLWLAPRANVQAPLGASGIALFFINLARDARERLAATLAGQAYNVRVVYGGGGEALEVSGSQRIDRASGLHVRDQITQAAESAGFRLLEPVQFNVEAASVSSFRVGASGSKEQWGDRTPVEARSIFSETGIDLTGDTSFTGGSIKNFITYGAIGLIVFVLITQRRR